jgi:hypothetical protein
VSLLLMCCAALCRSMTPGWNFRRAYTCDHRFLQAGFKVCVRSYCGCIDACWTALWFA